MKFSSTLQTHFTFYFRKYDKPVARGSESDIIFNKKELKKISITVWNCRAKPVISPVTDLENVTPIRRPGIVYRCTDTLKCIRIFSDLLNQIFAIAIYFHYSQSEIMNFNESYPNVVFLVKNWKKFSPDNLIHFSMLWGISLGSFNCSDNDNIHLFITLPYFSD